jgi:hypothetical protein
MDALLGVSAKGSDVAANNILPAQLTVEAKLKAAGAANRAMVGSGSNSSVSSSGDNYSSLREDYSASSRGAVETAYGSSLKPSANNPSINVSELGTKVDIDPSINISALGAKVNTNSSTNVSELGANVDLNSRDFTIDELLDTNLVNN